MLVKETVLIFNIMKTINRNTEEKKHIRTTFLNENHWSYFGTNFEGQSNSSGRRNDQVAVGQKDNLLNSNRNQLFIKNRDCTFIVDWQIDELK